MDRSGPMVRTENHRRLTVEHALSLCAMGYSEAFVLDRLIQERVFPATKRPQGRREPRASFFPIYVWQRPGLGYFFGIEKSGYKTAPQQREYVYGPFAKVQARAFLTELRWSFSDGQNFADVNVLLSQLVGGVGTPVLLIEVDAKTLAEVWKSSRFGKTVINQFPHRSGKKFKRAGTF